MKKLFILVLCILTFVFSACEPVSGYLPKELLDEAVELQLIYYDNPEVKKMGGAEERIIPFDFEKMEIIEVLSEEKEREMLEYERNLILQCFLEESEVDSPNGYAFRMVLENGDFLLISFDPYAYAGIFNSEGVLIDFYGYALFSELDCNLFFKTQLSKNTIKN